MISTCSTSTRPWIETGEAMMGHRQKTSGGDEWDVITGWRRVLCYTLRAGVCKRIKTKMSRRARRDAKLSLRENQ